MSRLSGRPLTCGRRSEPLALASSTSRRVSRQASGAWLCWDSPKLIGRPVSADSLRIQATSLAGASRSSPMIPAGASSMIPVPSSPSTRPMPKSSSSAANVPGTGSPSTAVCTVVREVEKPSAPAWIAARTTSAMAAMSSGVAGSLRAPRSPMMYARTALWGTCVATSSERGILSIASR